MAQPQKDAPSLTLPPRASKPRRRGITSIIDFGPDTFGWTGGEAGIRNLLEVAAEYIDSAKIYALNALLIPRDVVRRTARLYRDAGVKPFAGGILFEYAWQRNQTDELIALLQDLDIPALEISENYVTLTDDQRHAMIDRFQQSGIGIIYEFGRKNPDEPMSLAYLEGLVTAVAQHGIEHVTVEQCEIDMLAKASTSGLDELARQPWFEHLVIEVDPYRFPQQHVQIIRDFGPEVNLANVTPGQALRVEGFRRGIGRAVDYSIVSAIERERRGV